MVQGVDLWLNNPRRGEEACGTSGMKAAINGVLNLSILDGWFDEAYETSGGWAIGDREPYSDDQDALHASAIYYLLENEIVPMFYEQPRADAARVDAAREAVADVHQPAVRLPPHGARVHDASSTIRRICSTCVCSRRLTRWSATRPGGTARVREVWDACASSKTGPGSPAGLGAERQAGAGARRRSTWPACGRPMCAWKW